MKNSMSRMPPVPNLTCHWPLVSLTLAISSLMETNRSRSERLKERRKVNGRMRSRNSFPMVSAPATQRARSQAMRSQASVLAS